MLKRYKIQTELEINSLQSKEDTLKCLIQRLEYHQDLRVVTIKFLDEDLCPDCDTLLNYFQDYGIEYLYCPVCQDKMYDVETKEIMGRLE